ncbi:MAG TPA: tetratricopeptide repeat protein [bacterium]|nr:tetratricopeptide repeat protein [bacterium]
MLKKVIPALFVFLVVAASAALPDVYPQRDWTYRIKPDVARETFVIVDGMIIVSSDKNVLHFINIEDGKKYWTYGFDRMPVVYVAGGGNLLVKTGCVMHRLDYAGREWKWSVGLKGENAGAVSLAQDGGEVIVELADGGGYNVIDYDTGGIRYEENLIAKSRLLAPGGGLGFDGTVPGDPAKLTIDGKCVMREPDGGGAAGWRYCGATELAPAASVFRDKYVFIGKDGGLLLIDKSNGKQSQKIDITKLVDMRFWDEKPQDINNYERAALFSIGDNVYVVGPSAVNRLRMELFPKEISLVKSGSGGRDSTLNWALDSALKAWDEKKYEEATKKLQEITETWPDSPEAWLFLGMAFSSSGYPDNAIGFLERAVKIHPDNPDITYNLAGNYMLRIFSLDSVEDQEQIIDLFERVRELQPQNELAYIRLAEIFLGKQEYENAILVLQDSLNYTFPGRDIHALLLSAYYMSDMRDEAIELADGMRGYYPDFAESALMKGKLLCKKGLYAAAVAAFESARAIKGEDDYSLYPRLLSAGSEFFHGNAMGLTGDYKKALEILTDYVDTMPSLEQVRALQSFERETTEQGGAAKPPELGISEKYAGRSSFELNAEYEFLLPALLSIAHFQNRIDHYTDSMKTLEKVVGLAGGDIDIMSYVGYLYSLNGRELNRAKEYVLRALEVAPDDPIYLRNYAAYLVRIKHYTDAEEAYRKAIEINPRTEMAHYDYGKLLLKRGKRREAAEQFRKELEVSPDLAPARAELEKLGEK